MVMVSDDRNCRIVEIRGHQVVRSIGRPGDCVHDPPRGFASPNGDTPLPNGHMLVSEIGGSWVDEITLSGKLVRGLHVPVSYPSDPQLARRQHPARGLLAPGRRRHRRPPQRPAAVELPAALRARASSTIPAWRRCCPTAS